MIFWTSLLFFQVLLLSSIQQQRNGFVSACKTNADDGRSVTNKAGAYPNGTEPSCEDQAVAGVSVAGGGQNDTTSSLAPDPEPCTCTESSPVVVPPGPGPAADTNAVRPVIIIGGCRCCRGAPGVPCNVAAGCTCAGPSSNRNSSGGGVDLESSTSAEPAHHPRVVALDGAVYWHSNVFPPLEDPMPFWHELRRQVVAGTAHESSASIFRNLVGAIRGLERESGIVRDPNNTGARLWDIAGPERDEDTRDQEVNRTDIVESRGTDTTATQRPSPTFIGMEESLKAGFVLSFSHKSG